MIPNLTSQPLLRAVSWDEASRLSPWPGRIEGKAPWKKTTRDLDVVLEEYNSGWYAQELEGWRGFVAKHGLSGRLPIGAVVQYQREIFEITCSGIVKNAAVYGNIDPTQFLVSAGGELFAFDFIAASELHYQMVARHLCRVLRQTGSTTLVELGCGDGMNLVRCLADGAAEEAHGGEVCANARTLLSEMAVASSRMLRPFVFDYRRSETLAEVPLAGKKWVLSTVHSVEQLDQGAGPLVDAILGLPHRPTRVVHLEPAQPPSAADDSRFVTSCRKYAEMNRYNRDLLDVLLAHQAKGRLTIADVRARMFGMSAFNPTTLIEWTPS